MKITNIRIRHLRVIEDVGRLNLAWSPGDELLIQKGGGSYVEILTDEDIIGIGPEVDDRFMPALEKILIGKDPMNVEQLSGMLEYYLPNGSQYQHVAGVDIALWDIVGKAKGQPLYKLWGGSNDKIVPYAAMVLLSKPEERAEMALKLKAEGWQAIKLRLHHENMKEDIRTITKVREAVGDDMHIMVDANQAQSKGDWQPGVRWDYQRAYETALELQNLNCAWLEEPRPRYAFDELTKLGESLEIPIAGGENSSVLCDFEQMCKRNVYSILQPECLVLTGITETLKVGELAERYGKKIVPHNGAVKLGLIAHMHLVASWSHAPYLELINDPPIGAYQHFMSFMTNAPKVDAEGYMQLPQAPGLGVEINQDLVLPD
jgi:L-alanine-DL-glutamate epimerase-like enolase superfamily enzyme